jgi:hypothetical protein
MGLHVNHQSQRRKGDQLGVGKDTCWELATKVQYMVDVKTFYNTKERTNGNNACEEND